MMLLKAIHKISHTATHNGNRSSNKRGEGDGVVQNMCELGAKVESGE